LPSKAEIEQARETEMMRSHDDHSRRFVAANGQSRRYSMMIAPLGCNGLSASGCFPGALSSGIVY
jgi:hypothetical protein